jgi:hypothetical protein
MNLDAFISATAAGRSRQLRQQRKIDDMETEQQAREVLLLKKEGGKSLTVHSSGGDVALIAWRKNGGALLPLVLNRMEAQRLRAMLDAAIAEAAKP